MKKYKKCSECEKKKIKIVDDLDMCLLCAEEYVYDWFYIDDECRVHCKSMLYDTNAEYLKETELK